MISSQEIIERSIYSALLKTLTFLGYSLDPMDYYPVTDENKKKFTSDKEFIKNTKGFFIDLFGVGNNQSRGIKECPRITLEAKGFMPGDIGLPKQIMEKVEDSYFVSEFPFEAIDQYIDIHLVANNQNEMRLLHTILFSSIPQRGYIKPYHLEEIPFDGNIFLEVANFYDIPDTDKGIMEKVYEFNVKDSILTELINKSEDTISPIKVIEVLLQKPVEIFTGKTPSSIYWSKDKKLLTSKIQYLPLMKI